MKDFQLPVFDYVKVKWRCDSWT